MSRAALVAVALALAGCKLVALGDSNTCYARPCGPNNWPSILQRHVWWRGWQVVNRGLAGMTAGRILHAGLDIRTTTDGYTFAAYHLERLLDEEKLARRCRWLVVPAFAPVVVLALGTNDVTVHDGDTVANDILALKTRIEEVAPCVRVFVGLVPPLTHAPRDAEIARANAVLRARVPPERIVDFQTGFGAADLTEDGAHFTPEGQAKRAEAVRRAVWGAHN